MVASPLVPGLIMAVQTISFGNKRKDSLKYHGMGEGIEKRFNDNYFSTLGYNSICSFKGEWVDEVIKANVGYLPITLIFDYGLDAAQDSRTGAYNSFDKGTSMRLI